MDLLEDLGLSTAIPFFGTSNVEDRVYVNPGLAKTDWPRYLLEPIPFDQYAATSDESSEDDEDGMMWADSSFANGVSATGFGPGGEGSVGVQFKNF